MDAEKWYEDIEYLRNFVIENDYQQLCIDNFCRSFRISSEELDKYLD